VVADRVLVLNAGRLTHEFRRDKGEITEKAILAAINHVTDPADTAAATAMEG
jgi:hypothetical protein